MKLFEMKKMPEKLGDAKIEFCPILDQNKKQPMRKGDTIFLPLIETMDFFWLNSEKQFLVLFYERTDDINQREETLKYPCCYFGGMDESPFLVRLKTSLYHTLLKGGEKGFFQALKPDKIRRIEEALKTPAKRQGDIFTVEIPFTVAQIEVMDSAFGLALPVPRKKSDKFSLFGTRHTLSSELVAGSNDTVVANEALLEAPDHKSLELPGLHFFQQSQGLYAPREAD